jgi:protein O-GlcNAc transferase
MAEGIETMEARGARPQGGAGPDKLSKMVMDSADHLAGGRPKQAEAICRKALNLQSNYAPALRLLGDILQQTGRAREAIEPFQRAIALQPGYADAHFGLGTAHQRLGELAPAIKCFERALQLKPEFFEASHNLAMALRSAGRSEEALGHMEQAVRLKPTMPAVHNNYGNLLKDLGRLQEAAQAFRRALELKPDLVQALNNLGLTLSEQKEFAAAEECFRQAIVQKPSFTVGYNNLANLLQATSRRAEAIACYERALAIDPKVSELHNNLGNALKSVGELQRAVASYRQAIALNPKLAAAHNNLAGALNQLGKHKAAAQSYREAIAIEPNFHEAWSNLGNVLRELGQLIEGESAYRRALKLRPDAFQTLNNLGTLLKDCGDFAGSQAAFRRVLELKPDFAVAHHNLLMSLQYDPTVTPAALLEEHRAFDRRHAQPLAANILPPANVPDPDRRLRIGYVSGDFGRHPVGHFLAPVLPNHDRDQVEVFAYSDRAVEDDLTHELRKACDHWRSIVGITDEALAARIRDDRIDILVDLSGHTADNRLLAFARKPAPVQATWAGYVGTTGLSAMDYLITDARETPPGSESNYVEKLALLPDCYVCFEPPRCAPEVGPLPARSRGHPTFGCFNNLSKINEAVIALWSELLRRIPEAELVHKTHQLSDPAVRARMAALFAAQGIEASRLRLLGKSPHRELLEEYNNIDIALDPFPYSGGLTTLESLWMGVPVVTLGGDRFAARHSVSHLTAAGLPDLIADGPESYMRIVSELAADLPRLEALRSGLRARLAASPLVDGVRFARNLEAAYRAMWRTWCAARS